MNLRKILFWMHLVTGVTAAIIVFLMSVTGVALTYQRQLTELANRDYRSEAATEGARPLEIDALLASVREQKPDFEPSSVTVRDDAAEPALLGRGRRARLYVDRYTGEILGDGSGRTAAFLQTMVSWHRWLGQEGDGRDVGKAITGACNLGFLFLTLSGIYLWWPRNWSPRALRNAVWFRRGLPGKARDLNWHNVIGFWMFVPLVIVVASGVVISYGWASDLVVNLGGSEEPSSHASTGPASGAQILSVSYGESETPGAPLSLDGVLDVAASETPGWRSLTLELPESPTDPVSVSIDRSPGGQPALRSQLEIDRATGKIVARQGHADQSLGRRARSWMRFAHTGEVYGVVGQTIAGLASLGAAVLVYTGLALSWRRFFGKRKS
jgi:uncharacterized iron-regulated membrane protein